MTQWQNKWCNVNNFNNGTVKYNYWQDVCIIGTGMFKPLL